MFEAGLLGTKAPLYMDLVTIYFGILPFLMGYAILMAVQKKYDLHYKMQLATFVITLAVVVIFEVGVRVSGGFSAFMQESSVNYSGMVIFLITHILIALVSVVLWLKIIFNAVKAYKNGMNNLSPSHKKLGKIVYAGMVTTSVTGIMIYYFLFMY